MKVLREIGSIWLMILCVFGFVVFLLQGLYSPVYGDDLSYGAYHTYYDGSILYYPWWVIRHWWLYNGRMANYMAPLLLYFTPRWLSMTLNALVTVGLLYFTARCTTLCGLRAAKNLSVQIAVVGLMLLVLPWWDNTIMLDVSLNYAWASCFGLLFILLYLKELPTNGFKLIMYCLFAFLAAQMHEAMSAPLVAGLLVYSMIGGRWHDYRRGTWAYLASFVAGSVVCLFSPGIWMRLGRGMEPDDPIWLLVLKSDFLSLLLLVCMLVGFAAGSRRLRVLIRTPWVVFAIASLCSMAFSAVGGIVGRSGWFAQVFALISLFAWFWPKNPNLYLNGATGLVTVAAVVSWCLSTILQVRLSAEIGEASQRYEKSGDGTIYLDYTTIDDIPWYMLKRPRGVTPNSDYHSRKLMQVLYDEDKEYVVLPEAFENLRLDSDTIRVGYAEVSRMPLSTYLYPMDVYFGTWTDEAGQEYGEVRFDRDGQTWYYSKPLESYPGDRFHIER